MLQGDVDTEYNAYISSSYESVSGIAEHLLARTVIRPRIGIICDSSLGSLADHITDGQAFDYETIPNFPLPTGEGHEGRLVFGYLEGVPIMAMQGRFNYYEGYPLTKCALPVRVMKLLAIELLIVTNSAGALNPKFKVGDIMLLRDHINLMGLSGNSPLRGPNDARFGPRFLPMVNAYNRQLLKRAHNVSKELGLQNDVHEGVYGCVAGPNYETVAELQTLRVLGVDVVGMSTVNEVITARHCGMTVFALSVITNKCALDYNQNEMELKHENMSSLGKKCENICQQILQGVISEFVKLNPV